MPKDYMLERVQELSRVLEAIIASKKSHPAKALELIHEAFSATKFKDKNVFNNFSVSELEAFVNKEDIDYRSVDNVIDLLFEEAEIKEDLSDMKDQGLLLGKIHVLITYTAQKEREDKIFSFKRGHQRDRLKKMLGPQP
jgi:spore coat polysaccharide biosynthesis protein SpsF (cytidylyltransferase family)